MNDNQDDGVELSAERDDRLRPRSGSTLRGYLELMRLPNVFTAMADVAMGFLFVQSADWHWDPWLDSWTLAMLLAASSLLYLAGVILNDVFDVATDQFRRPERPLPSGRVSLAAAQRLGWRLMVLGVLLATGTGFFVGHLRPGVVAALLATCIVLYDAWLKRTPAGPLVMGDCRMLNVLLGMSVVDAPFHAEHWLVAGGIGVYITGVTWFARKETERSSRVQLTLSTLVMILGIAMIIWFPSWSDRMTLVGVAIAPGQWYLLTAVLGLLIVRRCFGAILAPSPARVRMAVTQCVLSIVMLDALACFAVRGIFWAAMILLLLLPALFFGRWIETT
jgi:4-hydroxybenzoate polyprenyltransferase